MSGDVALGTDGMISWRRNGKLWWKKLKQLNDCVQTTDGGLRVPQKHPVAGPVSSEASRTPVVAS